MSLPNYFISCDWGTSNFRLRLIHTESLDVLSEHKTDQGVKAVYANYLKQKVYDQTTFFSNYLYDQIHLLNEPTRTRLVVVAGMASSTIGLCELPYGTIPFNSSGRCLRCKKIPLRDAWEVLLISGVKSADDMMRGEEIQAVGLSKFLSPTKNGMLILPGTHSKHIHFDSGLFTAVTSFMTGELFELLSQKSILTNNVEPGPWGHKRKMAFEEGLQIGIAKKLSSKLFYIRAKHILEKSEQKDNYYLLSGMLIGDELSYLKTWNDPIFMAATEPFFSLYTFALEKMLAKRLLTFFDAKVLENSLLVGQRQIISIHGK